MALHADIPRVAMQVSQGLLVASIQVDLEEEVLVRLREDLLGRIHQTGSRGVILDVSGLETLDSEELAALRRIITMAALLGAETVLVGMHPGIVSSLIETGADVEGLQAAIDLDAAYALLRREPEPEDDVETPDEADLLPEDELPLEESAEWEVEG
jgi:rsbT antagonist protein RsbS